MIRLITFLTVLLLTSFFISSCNKETAEPLDDNCEIISFSLKKADGTPFNSNISAIVQGDTIRVTVPFNTNRNGLIPEITISGLTISPASGTPQNFSLPVAYTVKAQNGNSRTYIVIVELAHPGGIVYMGSSDNHFYALDALSGNLIWKYSGTHSFAYSSATYEAGTVYVGGIDNYVYAFDAINGNIKWKFLAGSTGIESDAVVVNGTVYFGTNDDQLFALNASTGQVKWSYSTGGNISASPTIANGTVYFGSSDGKLYALDENTGTLKWLFQTGAMINQSGPALANGIVYVGSRDSYLYAINAITGSEVWRFHANGISLEQSSATVANGIVYIGGWYNISDFSQKGGLYAVNASNGELLWEKIQNTGISSSPCVANNKLYVTADDNNLHALDAITGTTLWTKQILANSASPAVSNGIVYVGGGGTRYFYAFDANTGTQKWRFATPQGLMTSSPLIVTAGIADYSGDSGILN